MQAVPWVNIATAFLTNGLRVTYPLVSLIVEPSSMTLVSPALRSVSEYARRTPSNDILLLNTQIRSISRWGLLFGWGADVELDNGATFGLWSPKLVGALDILDLPAGVWAKESRRLRGRPTRGAALIIDARAP